MTQHPNDRVDRLAKILEAYHRAGWSWRQIAEAHHRKGRNHGLG